MIIVLQILAAILNLLLQVQHARYGLLELYRAHTPCFAESNRRAPRCVPRLLARYLQQHA